MSVPIHTTKRVSLPCGDIIVTAGRENYRAMVPPSASSLRILGSLADYYDVAEYRTNGRSALLNERPFFTFGETIQKGPHGELVAAIPNTSAPVIDKRGNPLDLAHFPEGLPVPLVELTETERIFEADTDCKIIITPEGGICEAAPPGHGWVWYKKHMEDLMEDGTRIRVFCGTGIAPVKVNETTGQVVSRRVVHGQLIFNEQEPAFGTFCAVRYATWYYLWGQRGEHIYLARVGIWYAIQRELYEFWNGRTFTHDMDAMEPVLTGYSSGSFFRTNLFGHRYNWGFLGTDMSENPSIITGYANRAAGPYQMTRVVDFRALSPAYHGSNCVYAHPWAFKEGDGQLMITWYEDKLSTIIAAKLQLNMRGFWKDISLKELPAVMLSEVQTRIALVEAMGKLAQVHQEVEIDNDGAITIKFVGTTRDAVDRAAKNLRDLIINVYGELLKEEGFKELGLRKPSWRAAVRKRIKAWWRKIRRRQDDSDDEDF
ncbi:hypothetical protein CIHG_08220 [Coccidioides immitis H538.4]|uniref:Uncharacterized protein n=2 Tax=Coccidioides immitis TaxID=5501 RepID=A0A0J8RZ09_COCIT|nr:hypothetical protein CIRG_04284 [Coccidioides immitis RMSCC 2394]KMU90410.1 hypothetical protein CIHG_08220 [Coccidioides immitis H538.4]